MILREYIIIFRVMKNYCVLPNTINAYSFLSHGWWVPLIKFMVGPTIYVRGMSTHL